MRERSGWRRIIGIAGIVSLATFLTGCPLTTSDDFASISEHGFDAVDNAQDDNAYPWAMGYFTEFEGKKLRSIAKGDVDLGSDDDKQEDEEQSDAENEPLLTRLSEALSDEVKEVRASKRLTESASCLVLSEQELAMHMRRMLEQAGQVMPDSKPVLEVNLDHQLLKQVSAIDSEEAFKDWATLLFEQAVLAEGGQLEDPAAFVQRVNRLMFKAG